MSCDINIAAEVRRNGTWSKLEVELPESTNYITFAILADVRNRYDVPCISPPRGIPDDLASEHEDTEFGEHSQSWLYLSELLEYNLDVEINLAGMVPTKDVEEYYKTGKTPTSWCRCTNNNTGYEYLEWKQQIKKQAVLFIAIIDALKSIPGSGSPDDVRIIFGFSG